MVELLDLIINELSNVEVPELGDTEMGNKKLENWFVS